MINDPSMNDKSVLFFAASSNTPTTQSEQSTSDEMHYQNHGSIKLNSCSTALPIPRVTALDERSLSVSPPIHSIHSHLCFNRVIVIHKMWRWLTHLYLYFFRLSTCHVIWGISKIVEREREREEKWVWSGSAIETKNSLLRGIWRFLIKISNMKLSVDGAINDGDADDDVEFCCWTVAPLNSSLAFNYKRGGVSTFSLTNI